MHTLRSALLCLALALALALPGAHAANLVSNGDFEQTSDTSMWLQGGDTSEQYFGGDYTGTPLADSSNNVFSDGAYPGLGYLGQLITTHAGAEYTLSFDLQRNDTHQPGQVLDNLAQVSFGGVLVFQQTNVGADWTRYTLTHLKASAGSTLLQFGNHNTYDYNQLDNVTLIMTSVPEPAAAFMLMGGLVLMALRRHRLPPPF